MRLKSVLWLHCQAVPIGGLVFALTLSCQSAPILKGLQPRGAQRGQVFKLTLVGEQLQPGAQISTSLPATFSRLAPSRETAENELPVLVQLREDAPVGLYPVRLLTADGMSNVLMFSVGILPEVIEEESLLKESSDKNNNNSRTTAQKLTLPATVNGTLVGPDQDFYGFSVKAGERLVFEVDARRLGSAIDPAFEVLDAMGKEVAVNNDAPAMGVDARLELSFSRAGEYFVVVHDAKFSDQEQNFYRLKIGSYPFAETIFPLGWQRGQSVTVSLGGGNLRKPVRVEEHLPSDSNSQFTPVRLEGSDSLPFLFRVGEATELLEPSEQAMLLTVPKPPNNPKSANVDHAGTKAPTKTDVPTLPPGTVMNGRISQPGEVDRYRVKVEPGQHYAFEVEAASLGTSRLLGLLALYDADSNRRLALTELGPESGANPFSFETSRNEVDPRLGVRIPEQVKEVIVTIEDLLGRGGAAFGYRLKATRQPPDFNVELVTPYVNLPSNGSAAVEVLVSRRGYDGPIHLTVSDLPEGIVVEGGNIPAELNPPEDRRAFAPGYLTLTATATAKSFSGPLKVWAEAVSSEVPIRKLAIAPGLVEIVKGNRQKLVKAPWLDTGLPATLAAPVAYQLELPKRHVRIVQGGDYPVPWKLVKPAGAAPLKVDYPRQQASIKDLRVLRRPEGMDYMEEGTFHVLTTFSTPAVTFDLVIDGVRMVNGKSERVFTAPAVTIEIVPGYHLTVSQKFEGVPGGKIEIAGKVEREPEFKSVVKVQIEDLPEHVSSEPVVVAADQTDFKLLVDAKPEAKAGRFDLTLSSVATVLDRKDQQEFRSPETKVVLVLQNSAQAGNATSP